MILNEAQYQKALRNVYVSNSDMVKLPADLYKYLMIITATCGRGKTHFALSLGKDGLLAKLNAKRQRDNLFIRDLQDIKPEEVIYLPPRKAITSQQLQNINCVEAYEDDYSGNYIDMTGEREGKIRVATAHKFAEWIKQGKIQKPPKIIILDELHSIFAETIFAESLIYISEFLKANWNDTIKIGLSATPQILFKYMSDDIIKFKVIDIDIGTKYKVGDISCYVRGQASTLLKQIKPQISSKHKVIYYTMSARECYKLSQEYGERSAFLISDYNETEIDGRLLVDIMEEDGTKDFILVNERLPEDKDIIFINSACREGMNIKDSNVKTIICEAVDMITIEQVLGRIRGDLERFMVVCNFNNAERVSKNIKELQDFLTELEATDKKDIVMAKRYQKQCDIKNCQKFVFECGENDYKLNRYAKAYLQYINECYIQIRNYETKNKTNYIVRIGDRDLLTCDEYLNQLCRYAEDGKITIQTIWNAVVEKNHENAIEAFQKIESEWINKPLGTAEKKQLAETLNVIRSKGKKASWNTIKPLLVEGGYSITDTRIGKERKSVSIISK